MIDELRKKNLELIEKYKENYSERLLKQKIIQKLLENSNCFFEISIEEAYAILSDLEVKPEKIKDVYDKLTQPKL